MAYNNIYPVGYQPMNYQPINLAQSQYNQQNQQQTSSLIWVQGEAGAKSYMVAPNTTVQLWDSESQKIYLKSADASGMPSMRIIDYTIRDNTPKGPNLGAQSDYVTRSELQSVLDELNALKAKLDGKAAKNESAV